MPADRTPAWCTRDRPPGGKPRVIIIGAGVGGLATGCYAQMSGLSTRIFEQHVLPGGCCTAWARGGYLFDYCIEWLIGTAAGNEANQIWRELGALDGKTTRNFEMFNKVVDTDGRSVSFYTDPDRLERHLLTVSPADAARIRAFCRDLRRFVDIDLYPFLKPSRLRTPSERISTLLAILPAFRLFWRTAATGMSTFAGRFQDPLLRRAFPHILLQDPEGFPLLPYLYTLAAAHNGNAGFPQGGSLGLASSIEQRYESLGGSISYRARVVRILVENSRAVGVELKNGSRHYADCVVSACDGHSTIYGMLGGRYVNATVDKLYRDLLLRPGVLYPGVVSAFVGIAGDVGPAEPHTATYLLSDREAAQLPCAPQRSLVVQLRSRYADGFAPPGRALIHCTYVSDFGYWQRLRAADRKGYWAEKRKVSDAVCAYLERRYPGVRERIEVVNVSSPVTTKRYTGTYNGSILAWTSFSAADGPLNKLINAGRMRLPGLRRFYLAGQWIGGGGLIRVASTGRFVAQYLCAELGCEFTAWESRGAEPWHPGKLPRLPQLVR